jgi:hypothetical protein
VLAEELGKVVLVNERVAGLKSGHLALVIVYTDDIVAHFGKTNGSNQTDISRPDDGNFDVFTHSAVVLFLSVENNRTQEQSTGSESIGSGFEPMRRCVHLIFLLEGPLG